MLQNKLFRKAALEKLSSPERLDEMMRVTSPMGWIALMALGVLIVGICIWGFVGKMTTKVAGQGILIQGTSTLDVSASIQGRLSEFLVGVGDFVQKGQLVATLRDDQLRMTIQNKEAEVARLSIQGGNTSAEIDRLNAQRRARINQLEQDIERLKPLLERQVITRANIDAKEQEIQSLRDAILASSNQATSGGNMVAALRNEIKLLQSQLEEHEKIESPYEGKVLEVTVNQGSLVAPGTRVLSLQQVEGPMNVYVYVPAKDGKKVVPGMRVRISPTTVKVEEYGFMIGEVSEVSEFPVSEESLNRRLHNSRLVQNLVAEAAPIEILARPLLDENTPSGFKWSSSKGPPVKVFPGTQCTVQIEVESKKPVEYVLPIFKSAVGLSRLGVPGL